jgi:hypothetical protein
VKQGNKKTYKETKIDYFELLTKCYRELVATPIISTLFLADQNMAIILAESIFEADELFTTEDPVFMECKLEDVTG